MLEKTRIKGNAYSDGERVGSQLDFEADAVKVEALLQTGDLARMEVGRLIGCLYYSDSRKEFEDHRTKDYSLNKLVNILAERQVVKVSRSTLHNCVAAYFQEKELDLEPDQYIGFGVRVALLRVKDAVKKKELVRQVIQDHLTIRELKDLIRGDKAPAKKSPVQRLKKVAGQALSLAEICLDTTKEEADDLSSAIAALGSALQLLTECHRQIA